MPVGKSYNELMQAGKTLVKSGDLIGAKRAYFNAIKLKPFLVQPYDNLSRLLYKEGDYLQPAELFRKALKDHPQRHAFYDRLGRSLMRISLSSPKQEELYKQRYQVENLFEEAGKTYIEAINQWPDKAYLVKELREVEEGLSKINYLYPDSTVDVARIKKSIAPYTQNLPVKQHLKIKDYSDDALMSAFDKMHLKLKQSSDSDTLKQFKKVSAELIRRCEQASQYQDVEGFCQKIMEVSVDDQLGYTHLKRILIHDQKYEQLHGLISERLSHQPDNNFIKLSLVKNTIKGRLSARYRQAENLLQTVQTNTQSLHLSKTLLLAKLYSRQSLLTDAESLLNNYLTDRSSQSDTLNKEEVRSVGLAYAKLAIRDKKYGKARKILKSFISKKDYANEKLVANNFILTFINEDHILEGVHKDQVMALIAKSYYKQGDYQKAKSWYRKILRLNPNNTSIQNCLKKL